MQKPIRSLRLSDLAGLYNLEIKGDGDTLLEGIGTLSDATAAQMTGAAT